MRFYDTPSQHLDLLMESLGKDLGLSVVDFLELDLDTGKTQLAYVIGDSDPLGITAGGQERVELEVELRLYVPISKDIPRTTPQRYALDLSAKIISLLRHRFYGLDNQRELPQIAHNNALAMTRAKAHQYCVRSIVFTQVVLAGTVAEEVFDVFFGKPPPLPPKAREV